MTTLLSPTAASLQEDHTGCDLTRFYYGLQGAVYNEQTFYDSKRSAPSYTLQISVESQRLFISITSVAAIALILLSAESALDTNIDMSCYQT